MSEMIKKTIRFLRKTWYIWLLAALLLLRQSDKYSFRYQPDQVKVKLDALYGPGNHFFKRTGGMQYLQIGDDPAKPYIIFIHGSPGSLWDYGGYLTDTLLAQRANLVSIDRQGFGYTDYGKSEGSLQKHADQLFGVIKSLSHKEIYLVGHSFGGPVQIKALMSYPEYIRGMVMVAPSISAEHEPSNGWRKVVNFPIFRWFTPPALKACNQEIIPLKRELKKIESAWSSVMSPITIVQGTQDKLVPMGNATYAQRAMAQNPNVKVVMLENENHFILWTKKTLIRDEIIRLLD